MSLHRLLVEKYRFSSTDAGEFSDFLLPIFDFAPEKRPTAEQCLQYPWLKSSNLKPNHENRDVAQEKLQSRMNQAAT